MVNLLGIQMIPNRRHQFENFHEIAIILGQILFQQEEHQEVMLGVGSPGIFAGIQRDPETPDHRAGRFTKPDRRIP
jgi:hypothetical protein